MTADDNFIDAAVKAFCETVELKLRQFRRLIPKGTNPCLTGQYVEAVVHTFISEWIQPYKLFSGTLHPRTSCPLDKVKGLPIEVGLHNPKQIDGIIFDPSLGPSILREGNFIIAHPAFCRGIIEIKTSVDDIEQFYVRLHQLYAQYFYPYDADHSQVMGIVIHDKNPIKRSKLKSRKFPMYSHTHIGHCPVFILFDDEYTPHIPAIESLIHSLFKGTIRFLARPPM